MVASSSSPNATLHALTERLASHSRSLAPLGFPSAEKINSYRQPAPPPQLPALQLASRHQILPTAQTGAGRTNGDDKGRCPDRKAYPYKDEHVDVRCARCSEEELEDFEYDMGVVLRREYDCWVEQCWTEAFHHLFTHSLPTLIIHLILTGSSPTFLRRNIVHGGPVIDYLFQTQMLELMFVELELRLSGSRPPENNIGKAPPNPGPLPLPAPAVAQGVPRDGVCFMALAYQHGVPAEEDDHGMCLCQLTTCLQCFKSAQTMRKGPISLLPYELCNTEVVHGWTGQKETYEQAQARKAGIRSHLSPLQPLPTGQGFVRNARAAPSPAAPKPMPIFSHPQMTDVLAVEEHLRWRLKEMGANDPAVEARYGPSTNAPAALEGVDLPEPSDDRSEDGSMKSGPSPNQAPPKGRMVKVTKGKSKVRRLVNGQGLAAKKAENKKDDGKGKPICYLPKEWAEADPNTRNMAIVLTFRHFVKLLHQVATASSPFSYPSYLYDVQDLDRVHPIALYRKLAEPSVSRSQSPKELRAWQECMDKWAEELGAREKAMGNIYVNDKDLISAVEHYTRAISLDPKKTVYFSNRAVALNSLGEHERAELDCRYILSRDSKNGKAFYQRALARGGMGRWREAEADLKDCFRFQPGNESAKKLMAVVKGEIAKLPKLSAKDVTDF